MRFQELTEVAHLKWALEIQPNQIRQQVMKVYVAKDSLQAFKNFFPKLPKKIQLKLTYECPSQMG